MRYLLYAIIIISLSVAILVRNNTNNLQQLKSAHSSMPDEAVLNNLPENIRVAIQSNQMPKYWTLVLIKGGRTSYYSNYTNPHWTDKLAKIQNTLTRIMQNDQKVPDGYYLLSIEDGIHTEFPVPLLGFASDKQLVANKKVILMPDFDALNGYAELYKTIDIAANGYPWQQKQAIIFWRGRATGADFSDDQFDFPRLNFMRIVASNKDIVDAQFTKYPNGKHKELYLYLAENFPVVEFVSPEHSLAYKYLLDIDGHSCSYSRMAWILYSNSLLLKHKSTKIQWYYDQLQPYVHYLPIQENFSDLRSQYEWAEANPEKVQNIISNARKLAAELFIEQAIDAATLKAFVDYHTLTQS